MRGITSIGHSVGVSLGSICRSWGDRRGAIGSAIGGAIGGVGGSFCSNGGHHVLLVCFFGRIVGCRASTSGSFVGRCRVDWWLEYQGLVSTSVDVNDAVGSFALAW